VPFLNYKPLKLSLRVFLASNTIAMVTYCVTKMVTTCSPTVGQLFDTMIVASSDKEWLSKYKCWKLFRATLRKPNKMQIYLLIPFSFSFQEN